MKLYFDESGQTGCVVPNKNGDLYRRNQRFFVLAGIVCQDEEDEQKLVAKYRTFLEKYEVDSEELKGTELPKAENEKMLDDFIENMLDDRHIYICCYDKIFYLASMISTYFFDRQTMIDDPLLYFTQQSALTREEQRIFVEFCKAVEIGTSEARRKFVQFMAAYPYEKFDVNNNLYRISANTMLEFFDESEEMPEFPLPKGKGAYLNDNITHLINLNALGESLLVLRIIYGKEQDDMEICHDHIIEFENEFLDTMKGEHIRFADSKSEILIQYADNVASVFRRIYTETTEVFGKGEQWEDNKQFYPRKLSRIMQKITERNIKFVTAISDWVLPIAVAVQFDKKTPKAAYNNTDFMKLFLLIKDRVLENIVSMDYDVD